MEKKYDVFCSFQSHQYTYVWLTSCPQVWDDQGKTSTDTVSFRVHENPNRLNVIQAILNEPVEDLTHAKLNTVVQTLELFLHTSGSYKVKILNLLAQLDTSKHSFHQKLLLMH